MTASHVLLTSLLAPVRAARQVRHTRHRRSHACMSVPSACSVARAMRPQMSAGSAGRTRWEGRSTAGISAPPAYGLWTTAGEVTRRGTRSSGALRSEATPRGGAHAGSKQRCPWSTSTPCRRPFECRSVAEDEAECPRAGDYRVQFTPHGKRSTGDPNDESASVLPGCRFEVSNRSSSLQHCCHIQ